MELVSLGTGLDNNKSGMRLLGREDTILHAVVVCGSDLWWFCINSSTGLPFCAANGTSMHSPRYDKCIDFPFTAWEPVMMEEFMQKDTILCSTFGHIGDGGRGRSQRKVSGWFLVFFTFPKKDIYVQ
jgi:hypothetical protein